METKKILYGAMALLSLTACVNDLDVGNSPTEGGPTAKIRINIVTDSGIGTRVGESFDAGTKDENEITSGTIVFYNAQKNAMLAVQVTEADMTTVSDETTNMGPNISVVKTLDKEISLKDGIFPSYMMFYANPIDPSKLSFNLNAIANETRTDYKGSNGKFSMSNSVFFDEETGQLQREVPVSAANFYQKEEDKTRTTPVTVYLERMAAKVTLKSGSGDPNVFETTQSGTLDGKTLKFNVASWGINGCAQQCYLSKRYNGRNFTQEREVIGNSGFAWNDQTRYRSYWAMTPFYMKEASNDNGSGGKYIPWVSDQANRQENTFIYHTYNEIASADGKTGSQIGGSLYGLENTVESMYYSSTDVNVNASLVSAVVIGNYTLNNETVDFYVHGEKIYLKEDYLKAMAALGGVIVRKDGNEMTAEDVMKVYTIGHPETPIGSDTYKGVEENKVTIQFNSNSDTRTNYQLKDGSSSPVDIKEGDTGIINQKLQANCGLASMYKDGKAYFFVPIRHLGVGVEDKDGNMSWPVGSFGLVRNHSYVITVDGFADLSFATLGKGVRDPEHPIVPPSDPNEKFGIKAIVDVLSWRIVDQKVILGNKN